MSQVLEQLRRMAERPDENHGEASVRLLAAQLAADEERCLRLVSIPHHFNQAIMLALDPDLPATRADAIADELVRLRLAVEIPEGFKLQDEVRRVFFSDWLREFYSPEFRAANSRLVALFESLDPELSEVSANQRDIIFHRIAAEGERGFEAFQGLFNELRHLFRLGDCGALLRLVHEFDVALSPGQAARLAYSEGKLAADLHRWHDAEAFFRKVIDNGVTPDPVRLKALMRLGTVYHAQREWASSIEFYERALELARRTPQTLDDTRCLHWLATSYRDSGDHATAKKLLLESIRLAEAADDRICLAQGHNALGLVHLRANDTGEALSEFEESLHNLEIEGRESAQLFHNLGSAYMLLPDFAKSRDYFERSLALKRRERDLGGQAITLNNLARIHEAEGRRLEAITAAEQATRFFEQVHDYYNAGQASRNLGRLHRRAVLSPSKWRKRAVDPVKSEEEKQAALQAFHRAITFFRMASATGTSKAVEQEIREMTRQQTVPWWGWVLVVLGAIAALVAYLAFVLTAAVLPHAT